MNYVQRMRFFWSALFISFACCFAVAQIIPSLPVTLQNATLADANQVMANFNAILTSVNANAAKNGINTDITALSGLSTPLTPTQGGSSFYYAGTGAGAANAQTTSNPSPLGFALTAGYKLTYIASVGNTTAMTLNVNALGAKNVYRVIPGGIGPLGGGEIVTNMAVHLLYDGTQFQLLNNAIPQIPGESLVFRGTALPVGFFFEDGTAISRTTYAALFAALGTTYGIGDGVTTFNLPDSRGRLDAGRDDQGGSAANRITNAGSGCVGTTLALGCGLQNHAMTLGELVAHTHTSPAVTDPGHTHPISAQVYGGGATSPAAGAGGALLQTITATSNTTGITLAANTGSTGTTTAMPILNPLLIANKIIRY